MEIMRYKKLSLTSRDYLRKTTLGGSTFFKKTNSELGLNRFVEEKFTTKPQELFIETENNSTNKSFKDMNPLEKGNFLEGKLIKEYENQFQIKATQCEDTFIIKEEEGQQVLLTANIDGYLGNDFETSKTLIEVKTSSVAWKDIFTILDEYKWQIQYYLYFFKEKQDLILIYYNIYHKTFSTIKVKRDPILQSQIRARVEKTKEKLNQRKKEGKPNDKW